MDALTIQKKIYAGRGKAALRIGLPCDVYRPSANLSPLNTRITTLNAAFNAGDSTYKAPNKYGDPIWYGDFDGNQTKPGDYLIRRNDGAVWFIAGQQQLLPIICVDCARSLFITRQPVNTAVGATGYGGLTNLTNVLGSKDAMWPASILIGGKSQASSGLPTAVKEAGWKILLPVSMPSQILHGDLVTDDLGNRFAVEAAELTDLGWRLIATLVHM